MREIRSKVEAQALTQKLINGEVDRIVMFDTMQENRVASIRKVEEDEVVVLFEDTVNGEVFTDRMYDWELADLVFDFRKDINELNDLESI